MIRRMLVAIVGTFCALFTASCAERSCRAEWVRSALSDFSYVGEFATDRSNPLPRHGEALQSAPREFRLGVSYVFHAKGPLSTEDAVLRLIPQRLRNAGVVVVDTPKSAGEFAIPDSGGPRWNIRLKYDGCQGELYNVFDPSLYPSRKAWPAGSRDDYVLVFYK